MHHVTVTHLLLLPPRACLSIRCRQDDSDAGSPSRPGKAGTRASVPEADSQCSRSSVASSSDEHIAHSPSASSRSAATPPADGDPMSDVQVSCLSRAQRIMCDASSGCIACAPSRASSLTRCLALRDATCVPTSLVLDDQSNADGPAGMDDVDLHEHDDAAVQAEVRAHARNGCAHEA